MLVSLEELKNGIYKNNSGKIEKNGKNINISVYGMFLPQKTIEITIENNSIISSKRYVNNKTINAKISWKQIEKFVSEITSQKSKVS